MSQMSITIYKRYDPVERQFYIELWNGEKKYGTHDELAVLAKNIRENNPCIYIEYDDGGAFASLKHSKKEQNRGK